MKTIYVECKPDFTLVRTITKIPKKHIIHAGGKSEICRKLEKQQNCTGLIDEDPLSIRPPYIEKMEIVDNLLQHELKVLYDTSRGNYLVVLRPRLEEWILKAAQEASTDVRKYGLPDDAGKLHQEINANLDKFERLIENLKDSGRLKTLKKLLEKRK